MKVPPLPSNENERLAALESYDVLDTPAEAAFDDLTELAAAILDVPIALVSLIDRDRQWFKSHYGLDVSETHRDVSFCGHVVAHGVPVMVRDAFGDERFIGNPLTTAEPWVRFYAGVPLRTPDGFVLGTLCAIDHVPKEPTPRQLELLAVVARQVVDQLEARRKRIELATEREKALENARRFSALFDAMTEGVVVQDAQGKILTANASAERILGLTVDQMGGRTSTDPRWQSIHEDGSPFPGTDHPAMVALRTGEARSNVLMGFRKPAGELSWIRINAQPLTASAEAGPYAVLTTFHDVTEIRAAHAAAELLSRRERLVTMGTLAAGVAHEINNPLAYVLANVEYTMAELRSIAGGSPSGRLRELTDVLAEAREGTERIRKIVRGLRSLAREESEPIPTDVASAIDMALHMAAHDLRHKATVVKELAPTPLVHTDDSRLSQVLVSLLVNAAQAFPTSNVERNRITVSTSATPDGRIAIAVSDNGPGIPAELHARIFDPFFSTKPVGQGTGLGLSIAQSIVTALGGELQVSSSVGQGTRFQILLPVAPATSGAEPPRAALHAGPRGRILVVDDEPGILSAIERILGAEHDVVVLADPRDALGRIERGERFDVIFCDLMMPHLGGDALYAHARAKDPALADRFVFITGGTTSAGLRTFLAEVPNERIDKPFNLQNLRGIARRFVGTEHA